LDGRIFEVLMISIVTIDVVKLNKLNVVEVFIKKDTLVLLCLQKGDK